MARAGLVLAAAGAAFGVLGLVMSRSARANGSDRVRGPSRDLAPSGGTAPLYTSGPPVLDAAYSPAYWRPTIHRLIAAEFPRINEDFAYAWMTFESAGNPCAIGEPDQFGQGSDQPREIGLGQLYNPDDFHKLGAPAPATLRAYAPAFAPLSAKYSAAKAANDKATMAAIARQMQTRTRMLTPSEEDDQVRWTLLAKIADCMRIADSAVHAYGLQGWSLPDYYKLVKAPHALPGILSQGMPAVVKKLGRAPANWGEFRRTLGMDGNALWARALNACEECGGAVQMAVS